MRGGFARWVVWHSLRERGESSMRKYSRAALDDRGRTLNYTSTSPSVCGIPSERLCDSSCSWRAHHPTEHVAQKHRVSRSR